MAYSDDAASFAVISPQEQIRLEDRVSYLYLERATIRQDRTGVVAYCQQDGEPVTVRLQLPVSGVAVLMLGPGTSISAAAMTSCTRSGATVLFTGGGGVGAYSTATALTSSARWAIAQARLVSSETHQRKAATVLYAKQLGLDTFSEAPSISVMRGIEGRAIKQLYSQHAKKNNIKNFRRDVSSEDAVNQGLNLANSILYGCAASACAALGINPALGIIHRGNVRSLLFDLADLYKPTISIPIAFACVRAEDPAKELRIQMRAQIHRRRVLREMIEVLTEVLSPHLPERDDDRLISGRGDEVPGHRQYGGKA